MRKAADPRTVLACSAFLKPGRAILALGCAVYALVATADGTFVGAADNSLPQPGTTTNLPFTVSRSGDTSYGIAVQYTTVDGSAVAGVDYTAASGSLLIPAGSTSGVINVPVLGQIHSQPTRSFRLNLLNSLGIGSIPSFAPQQIIETGVDSLRVSSADFNGDGKPDLVFIGASSAVSVALNATAPGATTPSFRAIQTFAAGKYPNAVVAADVNGDGKPDLLVPNYMDDTVSVLLNTTAPGAAAASFAGQRTFPAGHYPVSIGVADVNGDGKPDLVVVNGGPDTSSAPGTVSVLLNITAPGASTPSFASPVAFATGRTPGSIGIIDVNGDGKPDLVIANIVDGTVSVLLNTTAPGGLSPGFANQHSFATQGGADSVSIADVNGDGRPDIVVANGGGNGSVSVLLNITAPGAAAPVFAAQQVFAAGQSSGIGSVIDVNGDGKPDLVVESSLGNTVSVLLNTTVPGAAVASFSTARTFATGTFPISLSVIDVNGDGRRDLVVVNEGDATVLVLLGTTSPEVTAPSFAAPQGNSFKTGRSPGAAVVADLNGDGRPDLVVANSFDATLSLLLNTAAAGAATPAFAVQQTLQAGNSPYAVGVADFNGDGKPDLITADYADNTVSVWFGATAPGATIPSFMARQIFATGKGPAAGGITDVNGDGKPDLVIADAKDNTISILLNATVPGSATASFTTRQDFATGTTPVSIGIADFNGDGKPDLVTANGGTASGGGTVSVLLNTTAPGAAAPSFASQQTFATGNEPVSVGVADLNGDGKPDLVVTNLADFTTSVLFNTTVPGATSPSFASQQIFSVEYQPESVDIVDLNGDGKPDLVIGSSYSDTGVEVLLNTTAPGAGTPSFANGNNVVRNSDRLLVSVADINGDGRPDLIVTDENADTVAVFLDNRYLPFINNSLAVGTILGNSGSSSSSSSGSSSGSSSSGGSGGGNSSGGGGFGPGLLGGLALLAAMRRRRRGR